MTIQLACENTRFSSLFAAGDAKSEEKRMFSQATIQRAEQNVDEI